MSTADTAWMSDTTKCFDSESLIALELNLHPSCPPIIVESNSTFSLVRASYLGPRSYSCSRRVHARLSGFEITLHLAIYGRCGDISRRASRPHGAKPFSVGS